MKSQTLEHLMSREPVSASADMSLHDAAALMRRHNISALLVEDEHGRPHGILTEADLTHALAAGLDLHRAKAGEVASHPLVTTAPDTTVYDALDILLERNIRHLVVTDAEGSTAGIVTLSDIVRSADWEDFLQAKPVSSVMTPRPVMLSRQASALDASRLLDEKHISCVLVGDNDAPEGIVTERDIAELIAEDADLAALRLFEVMTAPLKTIAFDACLLEASLRMMNQRVRRLLVEDDGKIIGIVTQTDVVFGLEGRRLEHLKHSLLASSDQLARARRRVDEVERLLAEKEEAERRYRSLFEEALDMMHIVDGEGRIVDVNRAELERLGYAREELIGKPSIELVAPECREATRARIRRILQGEQLRLHETVLLGRSGERVHVELTATAQYEDGKVVGARAIMRDISLLVVAEKTIREQKERLDRLLSQSPAVIYRLKWEESAELPEAYREADWAAGSTGCFVPVFVSERIRDVAGYAPEECLDAGWWISCVHPEDRERYLKDMERLWRDGQLTHAYRLRARNGRTIWVQDQLRLHRDEAGRPVEVIGSWLDVSEQQEQRELFRLVVEGTSEGMAILQKGKVVFVNAAIVKVWGGTEQEIIGRPFLDFVHPEDYELVMRMYRARLTGEGDPAPYELRLQLKNGETVWVESAGNRIDYQGKPADLVVFRDITERKRAEQALQQSEQRLKRAEAMAHVGNWSYTVADGSIEWSDEMWRIFGREPQPLTYELFTGWIREDFRAYHDEYMARMLALKPGDEIEGFAYCLLRPDGEERWIERMVETQFNAAGEPEQFFGVVQDVTERRRAEQTMHELAQRNERILESSMDGVIIADDRGQVVQVNPAYCTMVGYTAEELQAMNIVQLEGLLTPEQVGEKIAMMLREGSARFETKHRRKDGSLIDLDVSIFVLQSEGERPLVTAFVRDITDRKRKERFDADQRRILEMVADPDIDLSEVLDEIVRAAQRYAPAMTGSILLLDEDGRHLRHGAAPDLPRAYVEAIDGGEIGPRAGSCGTAAFRGERVIVADIAHDPLWQGYAELALSHGLAACWSEPIIASDGKVLGTFAMYYAEPREPDAAELDLIESMASLAENAISHKRAEDRLRRSEARFRRLVGVMPDAMLVHQQGRIVFANPAAAELFGYESDASMIGEPVMDFIMPEDRERVQARIDSLLGSGEQVPAARFRMRRRDGDIVWVDVSGSATEFDDQPAVMALFRDVSAEVQLEEQLRQAQKLESIGTMAGGIAHDFNNMLAGMLGHLFLLRRDVADRPASLERIERIEAQGERAASIIRQLLTFARKSEVAMHPLPLAPLLKETMKLHRVSIPESIELETAFDGVDAVVRGDAAMIQQMLLNLLSNARDALEDVEHARIVIALEPVSREDAVYRRHPELAGKSLVCLTVSDNGSGIPPSLLDSIFDPFFTTKEVGKGTGLGLSMVYGAMQSHEGAVEVDSRLGRGTEFRLYFPRLDRPEDGQQAKARGEVHDGQGAGVLLVDDETDVCQVLAEVLRGIGYRVFTAADGVQALEVFARHADDIDIAVLDVVMPRMGGVELAGELRRQQAGLPILFHTGYGQELKLSEVLRQSLTASLSKPASIESLSEGIAQLLHQARGASAGDG